MLVEGFEAAVREEGLADTSSGDGQTIVPDLRYPQTPRGIRLRAIARCSSRSCSGAECSANRS